MSLKNFREENLIIESVYFCYSLFLSFLAMVVVAHGLFKCYYEVKNFNHKGIVMKPVLIYYHKLHFLIFEH